MLCLERLAGSPVRERTGVRVFLVCMPWLGLDLVIKIIKMEKKNYLKNPGPDLWRSEREYLELLSSALATMRLGGISWAKI